MPHKVIDENGRVIVPGVMIRSSEILAAPGAWRFESLAQRHGEHVVHCSRHGKTGRVHKTFHPHVFGLTVEVEVTWYRSTATRVHHMAHETWTGIYLGFLALIGLAFFENFHLAPSIVEYVSFGIFGTGGGEGH